MNIYAHKNLKLKFLKIYIKILSLLEHNIGGAKYFSNLTSQNTTLFILPPYFTKHPILVVFFFSTQHNKII